MSRTLLTPTIAPGPYPTAGVPVTMNAGDASNHNYFVFTANELILAFNSAGSPAALTLSSVADSEGRTGDVADTIPAGAMYLYGPFTDKDGWQQSGNQFFLSPAASTVKVAVIKLPGL